MTFINRMRLSAFTIGQRLLAQTVVMALVLALIATLAFFALGYARQSSLDLHHKVDQTTQINHLVSGLQQDFVENLNNLNAGAVTWPAAYERSLKARETFVQQWQALGEHHSESLAGHDDGAVQQSLQAGKAQVLQAFEMFEALSDNQSRAALELFMLNDLGSMIEPFLLAASTYGDRLNQQAEQAFVQSEAVLSNSLYIGSALIIAGLVISILLGVMIRRSIVDPVSIIQNTVTQVESGDSHARTEMRGHDELSTLGQALDHLLDEKVATLLRIEKENEDLNESVIQLLEGTSRLSERDLTSRLKIREDVTGPVADALNLMTREMAEALVSIHKVGEYVNTSSLTVDEQAGKVLNIARAEQELVVQAKLKLETLADDMARIADWCQQCDATAHAASATTDKAFAAVSETVDSMGSIREGISETEKRIKRLSERSQEISGIVDIISSIAERTHVLALNASMQAAAAGEAGRGFAVVADEVQRLAENARNATSQISGLVRNIQSETADAVDTMNRSISQVVDGSGKASQAGQQMQETQQTTRSLVQSVEQIATTSREQAQAAEVLKGHSEQIAESSRFTGEELARQSQHTQRLKSAAKILQQTVELFQLPDMTDVNIVLPQEVNLPEAKYTPTEPTLNKLAG